MLLAQRHEAAHPVTVQALLDRMERKSLGEGAAAGFPKERRSRSVDVPYDRVTDFNRLCVDHFLYRRCSLSSLPQVSLTRKTERRVIGLRSLQSTSQ
jgi:hypothetical protein